MSHSNHTLRFMSFPVSDISQAYRSAPERTEDVWQKVRGAVLRGGANIGQKATHIPPLTLSTASSPDPVVPGEEQPLPNLSPGAGIQATAGPGDQQRRASKHFPPGHMGQARGSQGTGVMWSTQGGGMKRCHMAAITGLSK